MIVNVTVPKSWQELTQKQLHYAYFLLSSEQYDENQIKGLCLIRWGKLEGMMQSIRPEQLAGFLPMMDWLMSIPEYPVRLDEIQGHQALYRPTCRDFRSSSTWYSRTITKATFTPSALTASMPWPVSCTEHRCSLPRRRLTAYSYGSPRSSSGSHHSSAISSFLHRWVRIPAI